MLLLATKLQVRLLLAPQYQEVLGGSLTAFSEKRSNVNVFTGDLDGEAFGELAGVEGCPDLSKRTNIGFLWLT